MFSSFLIGSEWIAQMPLAVSTVVVGGLVSKSLSDSCDPVDCSPPGSSLQGIFQARMLEWVDISFSRGSSNPGTELTSPALQVDSLLPEPPGKPNNTAHLWWLSSFGVFLSPSFPYFCFLS